MNKAKNTTAFIPNSPNDKCHTFWDFSGFDLSLGMSSSNVTRCPKKAQLDKNIAGALNQIAISFSLATLALIELTYEIMKKVYIDFRFIISRLPIAAL